MEKVLRILKQIESEDGIISHSAMVEKGISSSKIATLLGNGVLSKISRGIYKLSESMEYDNPDLEIVFSRVPGAVLCLISALSYYDLTTSIPHKVSIALPNGTRKPKIGFPPTETYFFSARIFEEGIDIVKINSISVRIYNKEKTIADTFKYRNKIGQDIAIEAIKNYMKLKDFNVNTLAKYAKLCRVWNILRPYVEALI